MVKTLSNLTSHLNSHAKCDRISCICISLSQVHLRLSSVLGPSTPLYFCNSRIPPSFLEVCPNRPLQSMFLFPRLLPVKLWPDGLRFLSYDYIFCIQNIPRLGTSMIYTRGKTSSHRILARKGLTYIKG